MGGMHRPTAPKCQVALLMAESRVHVHGVTVHALYRGPPRPTSAAYAKLTESALSDLGLGVRPPDAELAEHAEQHPQLPLDRLTSSYSRCWRITVWEIACAMYCLRSRPSHGAQ
jgi:hypothetical protein